MRMDDLGRGAFEHIREIVCNKRCMQRWGTSARMEPASMRLLQKDHLAFLPPRGEGGLFLHRHPACVSFFSFSDCSPQLGRTWPSIGGTGTFRFAVRLRGTMPIKAIFKDTLPKGGGGGAAFQRYGTCRGGCCS